MKTLISFILFTCFVHCSYALDSTLSAFTTLVNKDVQKKAAQDVLTRLLGPVKAQVFDLKITKNIENDKDYFIVLKSEREKKVSVIGPNGISLTWGVHYYLKNYCNCHISWDGDQLIVPDDLPPVNITVQSVDKLRYYQNVCTSSYSFVWWDWKRWQREIDWMALNGINLALAFTAQEAIWQRVYDGLGLNENNFTGPAFLAWNRMGNLRNFADGLSYNWHEQQLSLQHKILKQMRDLGMIPVLPAFCGIVPKSFKEVYPLADLTKISKWNKFSEDNCCPYFLNPKDPLFSLVSRIFLREYINEFGTNHIYNCDVYNENTPHSANYTYLSFISKSIYDSIRYTDPSAIWMIQGWMFIHPFWFDNKRVEAFVTAVPLGKMLILDLQSDLTPQYERSQSYYGQPFIWCMLHNFGGQVGMYGHLSRINKEVLNGRTFKNSTMVGIGITPEGIDQNYIMYEFTLESALRSTLANLTDWVSRYALRRYGTFNEEINESWLILKDTAYNFDSEAVFRGEISGPKAAFLPNGEHISKNILTRLPSLQMSEPIWYNRSKIFDVFQKFLSASKDKNIISSELFSHDLIDVTRQTIQFAVSGLYFKLMKEYATNDVENLQITSVTFLNILDELDLILGTGKKFLLGKWLDDAKRCATNENETINYEFNARNQITLWGPNGEIRDYAAKQWSGLVADYYKPRWSIFLKVLIQSLTDNAPYDSHKTKEMIFSIVEKPFGSERKTYPKDPRGNSIEVIRKFYTKWEPVLNDIFKNLDSGRYDVISL